MGLFSKVHKHSSQQADVVNAEKMFLLNVGEVRVLGVGGNGRTRVRNQRGGEQMVQQSDLSRLKRHVGDFQVGDEVLCHGERAKIEALGASGYAAVRVNMLPMFGRGDDNVVVQAVAALERPVDTYAGFKVGDEVLTKSCAEPISLVNALGERGTVVLSSRGKTTTSDLLEKRVDEFDGFKAGDEALNPAVNTSLWRACFFGANGNGFWKYTARTSSFGGTSRVGPSAQFAPVAQMQRCVPAFEGLHPGDRVRMDTGSFGDVLQVTAQGSVRVAYVDRDVGELAVAIVRRDQVQHANVA